MCEYYREGPTRFRGETEPPHRTDQTPRSRSDSDGVTPYLRR